MRWLLTKLTLITLLLSSFVFAQTPPPRDFSKETARVSQNCVKDAVIYEMTYLSLAGAIKDAGMEVFNMFIGYPQVIRIFLYRNYSIAFSVKIP